jgi:RND family efflux transporter MFP subunit
MASTSGLSPSRRRRYAAAAAALALIAVAVAAVLWRQRVSMGERGEGEGALRQAATPTARAPGLRTVELTEEKERAAGLAVATAECRELPFVVTVPGQIEADADRRMEIRTRSSGVIRLVDVLLGQQVKAGDRLLVLDCAEVATARLNLRSRQRDLIVARAELAWREEVSRNIESLIPELRQATSAADIERQFAARPLGNDRALLLTSYSEFEIARHEEEKQAELYRRQIVGEHPAELAKHAREAAQARFEAALEQVRYDADRLRRAADQQVRLAEASVTDEGERLRILGVDVDLAALVAHPDAAPETASGEALSTSEIVAPFDGTVTTRRAVPSQRAEPVDVLLTLVDLSRVRVMANVPESAFAALPKLGTSATIRFTAAAYPGRTFDASVLTVGAEVEPTTRTVVLLAETPNTDGLLKPGMFVQIELDSARAEVATVVPASAVTEIDGQSAVFVPGSSPRSYVLRHVVPGREVGGSLAIASGIEPGETVVSAGVFQLKSELLLQNEEGED